MGYVIYNLLLVLSFPFIVGTLLLKPRCRAGLRFRLGKPPNIPSDAASTRIWVHAVSLGEVMAVAPLIRRMHQQFPEMSFVVSTVTDTGREAVKQQLAGIAEHCYLPIDFSWAMQRIIAHLRPHLFLVVETEIWPNLLRQLQQADVPAVMVNGRVSPRSFRRYSYCRNLMQPVLQGFSLCLMQSEEDVRRIEALGAPASRVFRTGNMKFDQTAGSSRLSGPGAEEMGLKPHEVLLIAGSTHAEEETLLLDAYAVVSREYPEAVLLLAPRHLERIPQIEDTIRKRGFPVVRRRRMAAGASVPETSNGPRVIILDTQGELACLYALARMTFVGGTLAPIGGHNLLEPASWGKPVFFGPFTDHCQEIADVLAQAGGGLRVRNGDELTQAFLKGLRDSVWLEQMGQAARRMVQENQGVVERNLNMIMPLLGHG